jgi:hypothetical protein
LRRLVNASWYTASVASATSITDFDASTTRNQSTALTFTVTLSRVMVSCCSAEIVRVRMSMVIARSNPSGMIQYRPGPRRPR